jgi:serine/threonine protein kinase
MFAIPRGDQPPAAVSYGLLTSMESSFGKFRLLRQIGGGRLSQVFQVSAFCAYPEPLAGTPAVALKRVLPALIGEPAFVQLVVREAGLLARLTHASLCQCHELGVIDGCAFLTLDLVDGCTLRALMRRTSRLGIQLPPSAVVAVGLQLAEVLSYLHESCPTPLVHLDLSPQNVMLSRDGDLKLIDFGIARFRDGHNPPPLGGRIAGTVGYMSPEQARGEELDPRSDQFGLGILLWELLSGRRAFRGNTPETWKRMRTGQLPGGPELLTEAPEELTAAVLRLLRRNPARRFGSMAEARDRLALATSDPQSGRRPLAALVQRPMADPTFDPFDVVHHHAAALEDQDIPPGREGPAEGYAELAIEVDHGAGTPSSLVRAALPGAELPDSPFLETVPDVPDAEATAEIGG